MTATPRRDPVFYAALIAGLVVLVGVLTFAMTGA
jgi:hypothetical protein